MKGNISTFLKVNFETLPKEYNLPHPKPLSEKPNPTKNKKKRNVSKHFLKQIANPYTNLPFQNAVPEELKPVKIKKRNSIYFLKQMVNSKSICLFETPFQRNCEPTRQ